MDNLDQIRQSVEIEINFVGDLHIDPEVDNFAQDILADADNINILAKPYPILTTRDFNPADSKYEEILGAGNNVSLKNNPTGNWDRDAGFSIEQTDNAPAMPYATGSNGSSK